jgi:predicted glycosyltransferase
LCGGNKSTQQGDIERVKKIALEPLKEENDGNSSGSREKDFDLAEYIEQRSSC